MSSEKMSKRIGKIMKKINNEILYQAEEYYFDKKYDDAV
jgi:hypothetical protein